MLHFKLWYMTVGIIITAWVMMFGSFGFFVWSKWKEGRWAKVVAACILIVLSMIIFIYQVEPFNWDIMRVLNGGMK